MAATIHITAIVPGDVLHIALKAGHHLEPGAPPRRGEQARLSPVVRPRVARNFSRTNIDGLVTTNNPQTGVITMQVTRRGDNALATSLRYKDILRASKVIAKAVPRLIPVGGGPRAVRHPGVQALGVKMTIDRPHLLRVYF